MTKPDKRMPQILPLETQIKIVDTMYGLGFINETQHTKAKVIFDYFLMTKEGKKKNKDILEELSEKYFMSENNVQCIIYPKEPGCFKPPVGPAIVNSQNSG